MMHFNQPRRSNLLPAHIQTDIDKAVKDYGDALNSEYRKRPLLAATLQYKKDIYRLQLEEGALVEMAFNEETNYIYENKI